MRKLTASLLALGLAGALAGCAEKLDAPVTSTLGEAYATMDSQIVRKPVDPRPPTTSAFRGVQAIGRYETGHVLEPAYGATSAISAQNAGPTNNDSGPPPGPPTP